MDLMHVADKLLSNSISACIDFVCFSENEEIYVCSKEGNFSFRPLKSNDYEISSGKDVVSKLRQDDSWLSDYSEQQSHKYPSVADNSYPLIFERITQVFDHRHKPDMFIVHSASHNWEERGGHRGEHGSLDVVQSRAPFIISGQGAKKLGFVNQSIRLVDVAPTILTALGVPKTEWPKFDGSARKIYLDGTQPSTVIGLLFDGTNATTLYEMIEQNELPNFKYLLDRGTALRYGALSGFPSVTLPNHTSIQTGLYPGHHGILHNAWFNKKHNQQIVTESSKTWHISMNYLSKGVKTLHEILKAHQYTTFSVNEMADRGADYSTFEFWRQNRALELMPDLNVPPKRTNMAYFGSCNSYKLGSYADEVSLNQAIGLISGEFLGQSFERPQYMWVNFTLTDAAFHEGGPYSDIAKSSLLDSDQRLGVLLEKLDENNYLHDTMFIVTADHGMEENDPTVKGDWDKELESLGIQFRDESSGFIYFLDSYGR